MDDFHTIVDMATGEITQVPLTPEEIAARTPTLAQARADKLAALAERRWQSQIGGTTLDARSVKTDPTTTSMISSAYTKAVADPSYTIRNWKMNTGVFASLDAATIIATGDAIEAHVQACFDQEAKLTTAIMLAKNVKALASIDIENGWPT
jgi:hypothetical protein